MFTQMSTGALNDKWCLITGAGKGVVRTDPCSKHVTACLQWIVGCTGGGKKHSQRTNLLVTHVTSCAKQQSLPARRLQLVARTRSLKQRTGSCSSFWYWKVLFMLNTV